MIGTRPARATQRGAALFLSLLLLLLLTVTGVAAVQEAGFESRMARNAHDGLLAFQAAEAALASGERMLQRFGSPAAAVDAALPVRPYADPAPWLRATVWETSAQVAATGHAAAEAPRFLVEAVAVGGERAAEGGERAAGGGEQEAAVFRVVARATGGTSDTVVLLESTYVLDGGGTRLSWREVR